MSYCRFSSDNWKSDVYCYEHVGGFFAIHVAANRTDGDVPELPDLRTCTPEEFAEAHKRAMEFLESTERVPIGGPYDGQSFSEPTARDCIERLLDLREAGYHVPQFAIDELGSEAA